MTHSLSTFNSMSQIKQELAITTIILGKLKNVLKLKNINSITCCYNVAAHNKLYDVYINWWTLDLNNSHERKTEIR